MRPSEVILWCLLPFTALGLMTCLGALLAALHKRKVRRFEAHPLAQRQRANAGAAVLLDEPPAECPECKTPFLGVARSDFTPEAEAAKTVAIPYPQTEHFVCENNHRWFGANQAAVLKKRVEARRHLKVVKPAAEDRLTAKLAELADACEAPGKDDDRNSDDADRRD